MFFLLLFCHILSSNRPMFIYPIFPFFLEAPHILIQAFGSVECSLLFFSFNFSFFFFFFVAGWNGVVGAEWAVYCGYTHTYLKHGALNNMQDHHICPAGLKCNDTQGAMIPTRLCSVNIFRIIAPTVHGFSCCSHTLCLLCLKHF